MPPRANVAAMASMAHEVLVDLFKNRPSLGAELLSEALVPAGVVPTSFVFRSAVPFAQDPVLSSKSRSVTPLYCQTLSSSLTLTSAWSAVIRRTSCTYMR